MAASHPDFAYENEFVRRRVSNLTELFSVCLGHFSPRSVSIMDWEERSLEPRRSA